MSQSISQVIGNTSNTDVVGSFFGVYLLYSMNVKYKGRTYIGYTVDPNRRIDQHNKGCTSGGARRTNNRGPWIMVLIVHGFPNDISALRFEWAWQHPKRSRRVRDIQQKKPRESEFKYRLRVMLEMLQMGPWNRLPLTVRWLADEFYEEFSVDQCPPLHMTVTSGPIAVKVLSAEQDSDPCPTSSSGNCALCHLKVTSENGVTCPMSDCSCLTHILCLAAHFNANNTDNLLPVEGFCPSCNEIILWGDIILKKKGFMV